MAGYARDRPAPPTLAAPPLPGYSPLLLPGRSHRDGHLADRGRAEDGPSRKEILGAPQECERAGEPGATPDRAEARNRRGQDDGHGHVDRLANRECRPPSEHEDIFARVPDCHARHHDPRPAAGAVAERPGQLLPPPRTHSQRHGRRHRPGQDRDHQLPRLYAARTDGRFEGRALPY